MRRGISFLLTVLSIPACGGRVAADSGAPDSAVSLVDAAGDSAEADAGDSDAGSAVPHSCRAGGPGADSHCGSDGSLFCCDSPALPGGTFFRQYDGVAYTDKSHVATLSGFGLDRFEVTVGRFRNFLANYDGARPRPGDGALPHVPGSGWLASWPLAPTAKEVQLALTSCPEGHAWTVAPDPVTDQRPIDCANWYEAFAFCSWDGGRLPTEAEWMFAASGGDEQRLFPWSVPPTSATVDDTRAVYSADSSHRRLHAELVGSRPGGVGRWGHLDISGNVSEWLFDGVGVTDFVMPCNDCVVPTVTGDGRRSMGGSYFGQVDYIYSTARGAGLADQRQTGQGIRCARNR